MRIGVERWIFGLEIHRVLLLHFLVDVMCFQCMQTKVRRLI